MRLDVTFTVFRKEMTDLLRDRRSVFAMFVFPILLNPILIFGMGKLQAYGEKRMERRPVWVAATDGLTELRERIFSDSLIHPVDATDLREVVRSGGADAALLLPPALAEPGTPAPEATILFDESRDVSRDAVRRLRDAAEEWRLEKRDARLDSLGVPLPSTLLPIRKTNIATEERMTGGKLAKLIPALIVFLLMNGASFAAVDLFAGERERKTIETLLTSRADRGSVVAGKFGTVVTAAITAATLFLLSSIVMTRLGWIGDQTGSGGLVIEPFSATIVLIVSLPLAFLISAFLVLVSSHARSYREAQTLFLPTMFIGILPAVLSGVPGIRFDSVLAVVPILNVALAVRDALLGEYPVWPLAVTILTTSLCAAWLLRRARNYLTGEAVILGVGGERRGGVSDGGTASVRSALVFYASIMLALYYFGSLIQAWKLIPGLLITLWGLLLVPTLLFARAQRLSRREDLGFRRPRVGHVLAGLLLASPSMLAAQFLFRLQSRVLPVPEQLLSELQKVMEGSEFSLAVMLFAIAVSPGICEEILFRGLLLGRFRRAMSPVRAVLLSGFLFGLFHLSIYRILPTALLGVVAGALAVWTGSIFPSMALHFLYNGFVVLSSRYRFLERIEGFSTTWILVSIGCALLAALLLRRGKRGNG
ncbi:MAG: CPBP family intramembrane metalloprotease [Candidatus Eisenbacteria bacterium]|nr:CPBP family intramembrane metalloprotease [Candidatus Eisenbacteria bacterium]